jgi:hypothetical protein
MTREDLTHPVAAAATQVKLYVSIFLLLLNIDIHNY